MATPPMDPLDLANALTRFVTACKPRELTADELEAITQATYSLYAVFTRRAKAEREAAA